jgi:hypothetical protein
MDNRPVVMRINAEGFFGKFESGFGISSFVVGDDLLVYPESLLWGVP